MVAVMFDDIDANPVTNDFDVGGSSEHIAAILQLGKPCHVALLPLLIELLRHQNPRVRWAATFALGRVGDNRVIPHLSMALRDDNKWVRYASVEGLAKLKATSAISNLIVALYDRESLIRVAAAQALGTIGDAGCVPYLIALLFDNNRSWLTRGEYVSDVAGMALRRIGTPEALTAVREATRHIGWKDLTSFDGQHSDALTWLESFVRSWQPRLQSSRHWQPGVLQSQDHADNGDGIFGVPDWLRHSNVHPDEVPDWLLESPEQQDESQMELRGSLLEKLTMGQEAERREAFSLEDIFSGQAMSAEIFEREAREEAEAHRPSIIGAIESAISNGTVTTEQIQSYFEYCLEEYVGTDGTLAADETQVSYAAAQDRVSVRY
jgi:hypothetical protein